MALCCTVTTSPVRRSRKLSVSGEFRSNAVSRSVQLIGAVRMFQTPLQEEESLILEYDPTGPLSRRNGLDTRTLPSSLAPFTNRIRRSSLGSRNRRRLPLARHEPLRP